ncbi:hypothetical protein V6N13_028592 [Hibiscus sabdariffa]
MSRQRQRALPRQKSRLEFRSRQSVFCVTDLSLSPNNYLSCLRLFWSNRGPYRVSFSASAENLGRCPFLGRCLFCSILGLFTRSCFSTTSFLKVLLPLSSAKVDQFPADYLKSQISLQQYLFIIKYAVFTYLTLEITTQENRADNVYLCLNIAIKGTPNGVKIVLNHRASRHLSLVILVPDLLTTCTDSPLIVGNPSLAASSSSTPSGVVVDLC